MRAYGRSVLPMTTNPAQICVSPTRKHRGMFWIEQDFMGLTYANIELVNVDDQALARRKKLSASKIRRTRVKALVGRGAGSLAINERIQKRLCLPHLRVGVAELADGSKISVEVVGPVGVRFQNRETVAYAHVLPRNAEPLLGALPLDDMDLVLHPKKQLLEVNPASPDQPIIKLKKCRGERTGRNCG